ncbi:hypothetical protein H4W31_003682 [Plantactinospora soyae]|uniref:Uncharacterized protein n=1 Tax=Plantactinospora soyae TaxID=1544732 RepID=A0A927M5E9_9ACTN|nr:hypothetical protein [Plantactinospora soyae]
MRASVVRKRGHLRSALTGPRLCLGRRWIPLSPCPGPVWEMSDLVKGK